jgi:hypothetical protein
MNPDTLTTLVSHVGVNFRVLRWVCRPSVMKKGNGEVIPEMDFTEKYAKDRRAAD